MATWTEEETTKLIEIWSEDAIQAMLEGSRRNREIFIRIKKWRTVDFVKVEINVVVKSRS